MIRKRATENLGEYGDLGINPEEAVGDYIESKKQKELFIKYPLADITRNSLEDFIAQNEKEYGDALKLQAEMMKNTKSQKAVKDRRISHINELELNLRERFISVNDFIKQSESKKRVAEKKIQIEENKHKHLRENINKLTQDIQVLGEFQEELAGTVKQLEPYETVIKQVVEDSDLFNSVQDCMDRCDALMLSQDEISELEKEKLKEIEEMRKKLIKEMNDAASTVLGLNNELTELEQEYNNAKLESFKWEKILKQTKDTFIENELNKNRILDSVQQMYSILRRRNGLDAFGARASYEQLFDYIKNEIDILQEVANICQKDEDGRLSSATSTARSKFSKNSKRPKKKMSIRIEPKKDISQKKNFFTQNEKDPNL